MNNESKNWFVSSSELDKQEILTKGRRGLMDIAKSGKYKERVEIEWSYKPTPGGMPTAEQDKLMNEVAFKLSHAFESKGNAYLTAIYTGKEKFIMVFYTRDINAYADILHEVLCQYEQFPLEIGCIEDRHWDDYKEMLKRNGMVG